jgi:hypothetical protein
MPQKQQQEQHNRSDEEITTFIRPTQGLKLRQTGGLMNVNLENIGGRILYMEEMNGHKNRMKDIKSVISLRPPWGHEAVKTQPAKSKAKAKPPKRAASAGNQRAPRDRGGATSQRDSGRMSAEGPHGGQSAGEFDISILNKDHQQLYHDFVKMLCLMGNEDSRAILEQVYRESEEKKLLSGYTGIFPSLDHEEADMEEEEDAGDGSSHHNLHTSPSPMASDMQTSQSAYARTPDSIDQKSPLEQASASPTPSPS